MNELQRATLTVHGRVQGVFYRDSTRRKARELGLTGTVQNLPDGSVRIVAQGSRPALEELVQWASDGPPAAAVAQVEVRYSEAVDPFPDFSVIY